MYVSDGVNHPSGIGSPILKPDLIIMINESFDIGILGIGVLKNIDCLLIVYLGT